MRAAADKNDSPASGSRARRAALGCALVVNVVWSYCVMHLGRFATDALVDPTLCVALPCYLGYVLGAVPFLARPHLLRSFMANRAWAPTLALLMAFVATLLAFSPAQEAFPVGVFVAFANLVSGAVCSIYKAATYVPAMSLLGRRDFVAAILAAHTLVCVLSSALVGLHYSVVMLLVVFILPVALVALLWVGGAGEIAGEGADVHARRGAPRGRGGRRALSLTLCAAVVCTLCDLLSGSAGWVVSISEPQGASSVGATLASVLVGCALVLATAAAGARGRADRGARTFFAVMLASLAVPVAARGVPELAWLSGAFVSSVYPRAMFWIVTYDIAREGLASPEKSFGLHIVVLHGLNLAMTLAQAASVAEVLGLGLFTLTLVICVCAPGVRRDGADVPAAPANSLSSQLDAACRRLAEEAGLSEREQEVLFEALRGYTVAAIARRRGISQETVKTYLKRAYARAGCSNKQDLLAVMDEEAGEAPGAPAAAGGAQAQE